MSLQYSRFCWDRTSLMCSSVPHHTANPLMMIPLFFVSFFSPCLIETYWAASFHTQCSWQKKFHQHSADSKELLMIQSRNVFLMDNCLKSICPMGSNPPPPRHLWAWLTNPTEGWRRMLKDAATSFRARTEHTFGDVVDIKELFKTLCDRR